MSELRRDTITGRWVIIYTDNENTPEDYQVESHPVRGVETCPFCYGHEQMTPPEIYAMRPDSSEANTQGWTTRIVANKFPALHDIGEDERIGIGLYDTMNAIGAHEVIIETPDHFKHFADFSEEEMQNTLFTYKKRITDLQQDVRLKYILLFKNYGYSAGASLEHTHSQLIATSIIPKRVNEELKGASVYYDYRERCVFCDMIHQEIQEKARIVIESEHFLVFCPFASSFPFETWIIPKIHSENFYTVTTEVIEDLSRVMISTFKKIRKTLKDPSFNFIIHTSPFGKNTSDEYHWHIEIMPRLTKTAGFEWGSGFYINRTSPENAARFLRNAD